MRILTKFEIHFSFCLFFLITAILVAIRSHQLLNLTDYVNGLYVGSKTLNLIFNGLIIAFFLILFIMLCCKNKKKDEKKELLISYENENSIVLKICSIVVAVVAMLDFLIRLRNFQKIDYELEQFCMVKKKTEFLENLSGILISFSGLILAIGLFCFFLKMCNNDGNIVKFCLIFPSLWGILRIICLQHDMKNYMLLSQERSIAIFKISMLILFFGYVSFVLSGYNKSFKYVKKIYIYGLTAALIEIANVLPKLILKIPFFKTYEIQGIYRKFNLDFNFMNFCFIDLAIAAFIIVFLIQYFLSDATVEE